MSASERPDTIAMSFPRMDLRAITPEILDHVSSVAEEIHDVAEIAGVLEAERVAEFMQARKVHDAFTQERGSSPARSAISEAQRFHIRPR